MLYQDIAGHSIMKLKPKSKLGIVVSAIDGIVGIETGVGVVVQNFIQSYERIIENSLLKNFNTSLICLSPMMGASAIDQKIEEQTATICKKTEGFLDYFPTLAICPEKQLYLWSGQPKNPTNQHWKSMSLALSAYLQSLQHSYDYLLVLLHDVPFILTRSFNTCPNIHYIWISHGLADTFEDTYQNFRLDIESDGVESLITHSDSIGYISENYRDLLLSKYQVKNEQLIPLINELVSLQPNENSRHIENILERADGRKIIFSWGRCAYQKGFDFIIPAILEFQKQYTKDYYYVLLIPTATGEPSYVKDIELILSNNQDKNGTVIFEFDNNLPRNILECPDLSHVVFGSRFEGFSNTALEALKFAPQNAFFICSSIAAHEEAFKNVATSIFFNDFSASSVLDALHSSSKIHLNTSKRVPRKSFEESYIHGLNQLPFLS